MATFSLASREREGYRFRVARRRAFSQFSLHRLIIIISRCYQLELSVGAVIVRVRVCVCETH